MPNHDIEKFFKSAAKEKEVDNTPRTCIWRVQYEVMGKVENVPELAEDSITMTDYIDVLSDGDCREAIKKTEKYIMESEDFPVNVEKLTIVGCKKIAEAEI